ncbi:MAG: hypothetical protein GTN39_02010, partial [Candidatus Aenigmarchaeota archaeon]|nr:hypothetical protein [Candidatus Aenigmarchaeota archaeon]
MRRRVKKGRVKRKPRRKISAKKAEEIPKLTESLEHLMHQKEEIRALLSSLEDAYSEATIMEEDYREIKSKNLTRLEEINKKIETLKREGVKPKPPPRPEIPVVEPPTAVPVEAPPIPAAPPVVVEEKVERKPKKKKGLVSPEDLKKLEVDLAERVKEMVEDIGAKVSEK